jgi:hypothetical protein
MLIDNRVKPRLEIDSPRYHVNLNGIRQWSMHGHLVARYGDLENFNP